MVARRRWFCFVCNCNIFAVFFCSYNRFNESKDSLGNKVFLYLKHPFELNFAYIQSPKS